MKNRRDLLKALPFLAAAPLVRNTDIKTEPKIHVPYPCSSWQGLIYPAIRNSETKPIIDFSLYYSCSMDELVERLAKEIPEGCESYRQWALKKCGIIVR